MKESNTGRSIHEANRRLSEKEYLLQACWSANEDDIIRHIKTETMNTIFNISTMNEGTNERLKVSFAAESQSGILSNENTGE